MRRGNRANGKFRTNDLGPRSWIIRPVTIYWASIFGSIFQKLAFFPIPRPGPITCQPRRFIHVIYASVREVLSGNLDPISDPGELNASRHVVARYRG